jgi:serine protease Do
MRPTHALCAAALACALLAGVACASDEAAPKISRSTPLVEAVKDTIGSGLVVDESGLIVTNRHVTGGKSNVKVRLAGGSDLDGTVVRTDSDLDLAIVKIDAKAKLTVLPFAPDDMMVGEDVFAIGSPYGYEATVSRGIISALGRQITMPNDVTMTGLIQHDAPINPGNSGGPLININGEVVGVNVAMRDGAQNIAFAINAGTVKGFVRKHLQRASTVQHGLNVAEKIVAEVGDRQRVVVTTTHDDLRPGDEIRAIGNRRVANVLDLERALWTKQPGQKVELKVVRQGTELAVSLTLERSQGAGMAAVTQSVVTPASSPSTAANQSVRPANER